MTEIPKINLHEYGQWVFIMSEEDMRALREDINALRSYYSSRLANQSAEMAESSRQHLKSVGNMAVDFLERQIPPNKEDEIKPIINETREAIDKI